MSAKRRLSATVSSEHLAHARSEVEAGRAESVSAWVDDALARRVADERRLVAMDRLLAEYEAGHGEITEEEVEATVRRVRREAFVVRGRRP